jgi:DNA-directed RNA polymerase sigma subunit (sigma70/sigma32)
MPNPFNQARRAQLTSRNSEIRRLCSEAGRTAEEVGRIFDLTSQRVYQIIGRKTKLCTSQI